MKLYEKKVIAGAHCQVNEICDEPNTGLCIITHVRPGDGPAIERTYAFTIPVDWWDRLGADGTVGRSDG